MARGDVPEPSTRLQSFACPVCGAHAAQRWFSLYVTDCPGNPPTPQIWGLEEIVDLEMRLNQEVGRKAAEPLAKVVAHARRLFEGEPFIAAGGGAVYDAWELHNVFVSQCHTCRKLSIWLHNHLLYPPVMTAPAPNLDLSADVRSDYEEARRILDLSPRGAAALLRLAIQKICGELNAVGKDLNDQIADLVSKGLPPPVQQALDAVRVIGNEAVHPGQIDLRDDRDTVNKLFSLVNFIAEDRITRLKQTQEIYDMIPEGKRKAIERRDNPKG